MNKLLIAFLSLSVMVFAAGESQSKCGNSCNGKMMQGSGGQQMQKLDNLSDEMRLKLTFDGLVNMPILARTFKKNSEDEKLSLTKEQKTAIQKYKIGTMDSILSTMESSQELSEKLKKGILYGDMSENEALDISKEIAKQKESVLAMKINCILFFRKTLSKEQFARLLELDKDMIYINSPYNY